jgi:C-terminal processing protease CtpA/Prc
MLRKLHYALCLWFAALTVVGCSYTKDLPVLTRKQAIDDLDYLVKNLEAIHPEPFASISEEDFHAHVEKVKSAFGKKVSRHNEFAPAVAEMLALMDDSHTRLNRLFPDYRVYAERNHKLLPLALRYKDGNVIVVGCAKTVTPVNIEKGDAFVSINGKSIEEWLEKYNKYFSAETSEQKQWAIPPLLPACILMSEGYVENFETTLRNGQGRIYKENLPAALPEFRDEQPSAKWGEFPFEFHFDGQLCHFRIPSFAYAYREKYFRVLDTLLRELKQEGTSILVVDLRGNGGGSGDMPAELIRRTAKKSYKEYSLRWRYSEAYQKAFLITGLKQKGIPAWLHLENILDLRDYVPGPDPSQMQGEYLITEHGTVDINALGHNPWREHLAILVDRNTASAAAWMVAIIKDNELGLIAGEETGGRASFCGNVAPLYLPNSGLFCHVASAYFERPAEYDDRRGVLPDLPLDVTLEDSVLLERIYDYVRAK